MIPKETVIRLFQYYRALVTSPEPVISSEELSKLTDFSAAQIRKDLTYFGQFGTPGRGYNVEELSRQIKNILGIDREWEIVLVGLGNLGTALVSYGGLKSHGFRITNVFDNNPLKIGKTCAGLKIKDIHDIKKELAESHIKIAILTVPAGSAQDAANLLVDAGIKAILNFAPARVSVPAGVRILNMDVTTGLARLSYYLTRPLETAELKE